LKCGRTASSSASIWGAGQKGGLFLDQRENRAEVGRRARGKSVLNLFGYTGGFSLYAAAGGAVRTDTVDAAAPALAAARANFARNGLSLAAAGFHATDAFDFLERAGARGQRWDIVISDPPSFAPSRKALPAARRAYRRLHRLAAVVVGAGWLFCPASCSSHFSREELLASVTDGVARAGRRWWLEELRGAGFDHPVLPEFPEGDISQVRARRVD
jgi:23S rRNA (cytosine1962-C5)-methyltransferase